MHELLFDYTVAWYYVVLHKIIRRTLETVALFKTHLKKNK